MTDISIEFFGVKLRRIMALIDFGEVKKGELGGYIEKEENLSQAGSAWVGGSARVGGEAWVGGSARVGDSAMVLGSAMVNKTPFFISGIKHNITITETNIAIGCMVFEISHWQKNIRKIGSENGYTENEVSTVIKLLSCFGIECE